MVYVLSQWENVTLLIWVPKLLALMKILNLFHVGDWRTEAKIAPFLVRAIRRKMLLFLRRGDLVSYRLLRNQQRWILKGLPEQEVQVIPGFDADPSELDSASFAVEQFFHDNGFTSVKEITHGWRPLHYACLDGDPSLIQGLLRSRADPNRTIQKEQAHLVLPIWTSPLAICAVYQHHEASHLLIAARADVRTRSLLPPLHAACAANDPVGVNLLLDAGCDAYDRNMFLDRPRTCVVESSMAVFKEDYKTCRFY